MCGIVGYVGRQQAAPILLDGLRSLEYRGYDSAGLAVAGADGMRIVKRLGKVAELAAAIGEAGAGTIGIAHTRWATHGMPTERNAHPHLDELGRWAVVHNGIIENAAALRDELLAEGVHLRSDTDSELLAHLIARADGTDPEEAVRRALAGVTGTYGLAVLDALHPDRVVVARSGSPVVVGVGDGEHLVASDAAPIVGHTRRVLYLEDGEIATVMADQVHLSDLDGHGHRVRLHNVGWEIRTPDMSGYDHFLRKEILEQPEAVARTLTGRLRFVGSTTRFELPRPDAELATIRRVTFLGCGSAYYAGKAGATLVERIARIPADAEAASEFRYREPVIEPTTLYVALSQSGETLDTIRAVQAVQERGAPVAGVVNVEGSTLARMCDSVFPVHAGNEVSVTSTKTFTSTVVALALLAIRLGRLRGLDPSDARRLLHGLEALPDLLAATLRSEDRAAAAADWLHEHESAYFIGRVAGFPVALEGAQKLKEVSYIHAEAYPSAELKHGPLSLVTPAMPTIAVVPDDELFHKNVATVEEIKARGGPVLAVGHRSDAAAGGEVLMVPRAEPELDPVLLTVPLQLLAYHTAVLLGVDVDKPRNLAKSVTVE